MEPAKEKEPATKAPETISLQIRGGRIVISDYSRNNDYKPLLALFGIIGIKPEVKTESWCG